jgi:curved DNA-binding protein CbpA
MKTTAYDILEVSADATQEEIEAAYREQVQTVDPALLKRAATSDTAFRYKLLREAHALISDPSRRLAYDLALRYPPSPASVAPKAEPGYRVWCSPGVVVLLIAAFFLGSALWAKHAYDVREAKREEERSVAERLEQARLARIEQAREEAAMAEERRFQSQLLAGEHRNRVEMEQARYEGELVHDRLWQAERAAAERERWALYEQERRARYEEYREQRLVQQRRYIEQRDAERRLREFEGGPWISVLPPPRRLVSDAR